MRTVIPFLVTILVCSVAWPQQLVTGKITDATDGTPVAGASITVANTTIGTTSDMSGNYSLTVPVQGSFETVVSHAGYQPVFYRIEIPQNVHQYNVALEIHELEEIVVGAAKTYSNSDVTLFWQKILGERPSRNGMQVLNAEKVYFYKSGQILKASCSEPIEIINHHTGYHIRYMLQSFQHDYTGNATEFYGMPFFEELVPQNSRQQNRWEKKRQEVYAVSLNHFLRAFYHRQIHEEGFFVIDPFVFENVYQPPPSDYVPSGQTGIPQSPFGSTITDEHVLARQEFFEKVRTDYQRRNQISYLLSDYRRMIETTPSATLEMVSDHVISSLRQKNTILSEQHAVQVNIVDSLILLCISKPAADLKGRTASYPVMVGIPPQQLTLFSDGSYTGMLKIQEFRGNSISLSALSSVLPVEYVETTQNLSIPSYSLEQTVKEYLAAQLEAWPQEKLHLHTDRDFYVPGEKIWFKAYLTDAATHQNSTQSRYVYAELISPVDTPVCRVMIRPSEDGLFHGHLFLSEVIPEGNYTLRAYTRYMENLGDDYFFKKNIRIGNLEGGNGGNRVSGGNRRNSTLQPVLSRRGDFDVSFFPEGGNLVEGVLCKVAFKALNRNGYFETISGEIVDETGSVITSVQTLHAGMGVFAFFPESSKRYYLRCRNGNGLEKRFELPNPDPRVCTLTISQHQQRISVSLLKPANSPNNPYYLLAQCRGEAICFMEWDKMSEPVIFAEEVLPAGIIQFVLFDEQLNPLSERLVFNKNYDEAKVEFRTDKEFYGTREKVVSTLSLTDSDGYFLNGRLSVAITDDMDIAADSSTTILTSLLLTSELKGYIENPAYYLQNNPESETALDYLMMVHGWRRYNIPEVVKGNLNRPKIPYQTSQEISGKARGLFLRPVVNSDILVVTEDGDFGFTSTDENGIFRLHDFEYPDSTAFFIQALTKRGSINVELVLDGESFPKTLHAPQSPHLTPALSKGEGESDPNAFIAKAEQRALYDGDMRIVHLEEIVVEAPRIVRERRLDFAVNIAATVTVRREDMKKNFRNPVFAPEMLFGTGVYVGSDGKIIMSGGPVSLASMGSSPIIMIDGYYAETEDFLQMPADWVESIDLIKGYMAAMFGIRGTPGVISITTRMGGDIEEKEPVNSTVYTPLGYQKPVEFYAPKYETLESKHLSIPDYRTTIFWKPDVVLSEEVEVSFDFYTSDFLTTYSVVIEGLTDDGKIVRQVEKIRVTGLQGNY